MFTLILTTKPATDSTLSASSWAYLPTHPATQSAIESATDTDFCPCPSAYPQMSRRQVQNPNLQQNLQQTRLPAHHHAPISFLPPKKPSTTTPIPTTTDPRQRGYTNGDFNQFIFAPIQ